MKHMKKVAAIMLGAALITAQGGVAEAASKSNPGDKNRNGIADKWEKKYKLKGKNIAAQDNDKDGLNNLIEYKLKLNPKAVDTNKNGIADGLEDKDKDGLSNQSELAFKLNPANPDTDRDKVLDGNETDKQGVKLADKINEFEIEIKTADKKKIEIEYEIKKGQTKLKVKDQTRTVTKETIIALVQELQKADSVNEDELLAKIQELFKLEGSFSIEVELEFANGDEIEFEKEVDGQDQSPSDDEDDDDDEDEEQVNAPKQK